MTKGKMSELTEKLMRTYGKQNTPRLIRKIFNIEKAMERELNSNNMPGISLLPHRDGYYSHRLHVLESVLKKRGVDFNDFPSFKAGDRYKYERYN